MVLVSYFSVLIGLSFSHIGYYLNVFDGRWKIGSLLTYIQVPLHAHMAYRKNWNNRVVCYVVENFLL